MLTPPTAGNGHSPPPLHAVALVCLLALTLRATSTHATSAHATPLLSRRQLISEGGKRLTRSSGAAAPYGPAPLPLDPLLPPWEQLKDRHAGQECLFIGNGPSLNKLDWSFLNAAKLPVVMGAPCAHMHVAARPAACSLAVRCC
jgi:hypothetical protein